MIITGVISSVALLAFLAIGAALGRTCLRWLGVPTGVLETPVGGLSALAVGWLLISHLLFVIGWMGLFRPGVLWTALLVSAALGAPQWRAVALSWQRLRKAWERDARQLAWIERWIVRLLVVHAVVSGVAAWAPTTFWDALAYHLGLPRLFLWHQQMRGSDGGIIFARGSLAMELLYSLGLSLKLMAWPALLHWSCGVLSAVTLYWTGRAWWSTSAGVWASAAVYLTPAMNTLSGGAFVDLALLWDVCLACWAFGEWLTQRHRAHLMLMGVCVGGACAVKLSGLMVLALLVTCVGVAQLRQGQRLTRALRDASLAGLFGLAMVAPWLLRGWIEYGSPLAVGEAMRSVGYAYPRAPMGGLGPIITAGLRWPFAMVWHPEQCGGWRFSWGPWMWLLVPLVWICPRDRRVVWCLACGVALLACAYLASVDLTRLLIPAVPSLALVAGYVGSQQPCWRMAVRTFLGVSLGLWGLVNGGLLLAQDAGRLPVIVGAQTREQYLAQRLETYPVIAYANAQLPREAIVCMMDPRIAYLERAVRVGDPSYQLWLPLAQDETAASLLATWQRYGITHLMINWSYVDRWTVDAGPTATPRARARWEVFRRLWTQQLRAQAALLTSVGRVELYAIPGASTR